MKKRVLSRLLILVLALRLLPVGAFAAGTTVEEYCSGLPLMADPGTGKTAWIVSGDMLKSGNEGKAYTTSTLKLTFTEDTQFSFEYKVSCEDKYDKFTISKGEKEERTESGDLGWKTWSGEVQAGDIVTLAYKKDSGGDKYDDCVYLRNFSCGEGVTVTFHNGEETATQTVYGTGTALKANTFTKDHAVFAGWSTTVNGTVDYADGAFVSPAEPMDLYAVWTAAFVVTFVDGSKTATQNVPENGTLDSLPTASGKTGYTFAGWFVEETEVTLETAISGDMTCTAKYTPITYTIRFNANGGSGEMEDMTAVYDETVTLPDNAFTRDGYRFTGWGRYTSSASYQAGESVKNLQSKQDAVQTLYAIWAGLPVPVTIDLNDGSAATHRTCVVGQSYDYIYVESGGSSKWSKLSAPKRERYNFKGWYTEADGGEAITTGYKFSSTSPVTLYAHWAEAVTVTFDANGGSCSTTSKAIDKGTAYGTLPTARLSGKVFEGWFTDLEAGEKAESTTVFTKDTTLYARYRPYQMTVMFNANGGEGEMEPCVVSSGVPTKLPENTFTRSGYRFVKWTDKLYPSTWSPATDYADEGEFIKTATSDNSEVTLYAVWEQTVFGKACEAVEKVLPTDGILRPGSALTLPTQGEGYTIAYTGADFTFPESGTAEVTFTVTVTDTSAGETESRDYTLTLYSPQSVRAEAELTAAAAALTGNFTPVFGKDVNANTAVEAILAAKGYEGITVSVKEPGTSANASITEDGTINYYFNPGMTGTGGYFYTTFRLEKGGVTAEKRWYCNIGWDKERAHKMLEQAASRVLVPEEPVSELKLLRHPLKVGGELKDSYTYSDVDTWATVTWTSGNPDLIKIGDYANDYGPYATTLNNPSPLPQEVTLAAAIKCNNVDKVLIEKSYTVILAGLAESTAQSVREALLAKLEAGLASPGLTDQVTGEPLDPENVVHDILFPTTRDFKIDGKYYPVTITSSNPDVIVAPDVNNAARVEVYRPAPGADPVEVTLTLTITEKSSGIAASRDITVTVQPLTQVEIDAELALMERVKAQYFEGLKGGNPSANAITMDLDYFFEVYAGENGELVWVRSNADRANHGIVPVPMNGWEVTEQWRLFRSSNPEVIAHENLLVTRQKEHKAVTVTSYLSSETLGKYAERYPGNADLQKLYYQPVSVDLVVTGTAPTVNVPAEERLTVTFTLQGNGSFGFTQTYRDLSEGTTVFEIFSRALTAHGYTYAGHGTYIEAITTSTGVTLSELDEGENSGWMYRINGAIPDVYMGARTLKNGDVIKVFYTGDFTNESGYAGGWDTVNVKDKDTPLAEVSGFVDVPETAWYAAAVEYVCMEGLMIGMSEDRFVPDGDLSRAMLAAVLYRMESSPAVTAGTAFADVPEDTWYTSAITWGAESEVLSGMGDGTFLPNRGVTRQELVTILYRYARYLGMDIDEQQKIDRFSDAEEVSEWGYDAVTWAVANGLLCGTDDGRLNPNGNAARAEVAVIFHRFAVLRNLA